MEYSLEHTDGEQSINCSTPFCVDGNTGTDCSNRSKFGIYIHTNSHDTLLHMDHKYYDVDNNLMTSYIASGNSESREDFPTDADCSSCT